jgi:hypothetical protein
MFDEPPVLIIYQVIKLIKYYTHMRRTLFSNVLPLFLLFTLFFTTHQQVFSQQKRALLVGIDEYAAPKEAVKKSENQASAVVNRNWGDLDGCVNDAQAIGEMLRVRFGFSDEEMTFLFNKEATRARIIEEIEGLISASTKGDIAFIFYAGHGSYVFNSRSREENQRDESLVPADSYLGALDIRDKEMSRMLNQFLDKGVVLTTIFDCCHSGSNTRGALAKTRHLEWDPRDVADSSYFPSPASRGALVMASAQDFELAQEDRNELGQPHGAFTLALLKALNSLPANASAAQIFENAQTYMRANGKKQVPVIEGTPERKKLTLLGIDQSNLSNKTLVSVFGKDKETVSLQGGFAIGLRPGCELVKVGSEGDSIRLKITEVSSLTRSRAKVVVGNLANVATGNLFEVVVWANTGEPNLRVWIPQTSFKQKEIEKFRLEIEKLKKSKVVELIADASELTPDYEVLYSGGNWLLRSKDKEMKEIKSFKASTIESMVGNGKPRLYIHIPPSEEMFQKIKLHFETKNNAIAIVNNIEEAHYLLTGRFVEKNLYYSWLLPSVSKDDASYTSPLPYRTDWLQHTQNNPDGIIEKLGEFALRLGKIRAWLTLKSPPDMSGYPYKLSIKDVAANEFVTDGKMYEGKMYRLYLHATKEQMDSWRVGRRYVYVLTIDNTGKTQVIFPPAPIGSVENFLPIMRGDAYPLEIPLSSNFKIVPPLGTDTFILLTTSEALPNPDALSTEGVLSRGPSEKSDNPLMNLLLDVGTNSRSRSLTSGASWTVNQTTFISTKK